MLFSLKTVSFLLLTLMQVTFLPFNFAFTALLGFNFYTEKESYFGWIVFISVLLGLLGVLDIGATIIALTVCFIILDFIRSLIPNNQFAKVFLIFLALPLSEVFLMTLNGVIK